jgi:SAM-dependent methyltransferase
MPIRKDLHEENRLSWNEATQAHNSHKRDQVRFLREGGQTLYPEEVELLGDVRGLRLVHLQCNSGQDSLSLAQRGAIVTGVDISDTAIAFAQQLATASGIRATFVRMDVYDWLEQTARGGDRFDIAFSSYGALCWLSDLRSWAKGIASILRLGGRLAVVDFHPLLMMFDDKNWALRFPYFGSGEAATWADGIGDYVANSGAALAPSGYLEGVQGFRNPHCSHEWRWTIGDILTAVLDAGLELTAFREYPYCNGDKFFPDMREIAGRRMIPPDGIPSLPLMFGLAAQKPGLHG